MSNSQVRRKTRNNRVEGVRIRSLRYFRFSGVFRGHKTVGKKHKQASGIVSHTPPNSSLAPSSMVSMGLRYGYGRLPAEDQSLASPLLCGWGRRWVRTAPHSSVSPSLLPCLPPKHFPCLSSHSQPRIRTRQPPSPKEGCSSSTNSKQQRPERGPAPDKTHSGRRQDTRQ